jgi:predicted nucleic acid-binding Zn ribbon protein
MLIAFRDVLRKTARTLGIEPAMHLAEARQAWAEVTGAALAAVTEPRALRGGTLVVAAAYPHAAQEVRLRAEEILAALRRRVAGSNLHTIRVVIRAPVRRGV